MKTPAHTPTPLELLGRISIYDGNGNHVTDVKGFKTTDTQDEQMATRIVHCVNTHATFATSEARLREALEAVLVKFQLEYEHLTDGAYGTIEDMPVVMQARAALAPVAGAQP